VPPADFFLHHPRRVARDHDFAGHVFITVANLLQPGASYGTTSQDVAAWNQALAATTITVS
jgi:hypothetical protein